MQVSTSQELEGAKVVRTIGRITAGSTWHGCKAGDEAAFRNQALAALISQAKEYEANAILDIAFETCDAQYLDLSGVPVQQTKISGLAVKTMQVREQ